MKTDSTLTRRASALALAALLAGAGLAGCGSDDDDAAEFCEKFRTFEDEQEQLAQDNVDNPEDVDFEDLQAQFADAADDVESLNDTAPEEIADDVETATEAVTAQNEAVQAASSLEEVEDDTGSVSEDELEAADGRVEDWIQDNCDSEGDTK